MDYGCYDRFKGLSASPFVPVEEVECNTTCFVKIDENYSTLKFCIIKFNF
jgi:hypothetical protein